MLISIAAKTLISRNELAFERSQLLYETLILGPAEAGRCRIAVALRTAQRVSSTIANTHADKIFKRCLLLSGGQVDPYAAPALRNEALSTAAAILQDHVELDQVVVSLVSQGVTEALRAVVAAALQRRSLSRPEFFGSFIKAWNPSRAEAIRFAQDADSRFSAADPVFEARRGLYETFRGVFLLSQSFARRVLPALIGPALVALVFLTGPLSLHIGRIGYGVGFASLGLLVAVNVVSTELTATRLPGLVARYSAAPGAIKAGYSLALTLLLIVAVRSALPIDQAVLDLAGILVLSAFLISLTSVMFELLRRLQAGQAWSLSRRRDGGPTRGPAIGWDALQRVPRRLVRHWRAWAIFGSRLLRPRLNDAVRLRPLLGGLSFRTSSDCVNWRVTPTGARGV